MWWLIVFGVAAHCIACNSLWGITEPIDIGEIDAGTRDSGASKMDAAADAANGDAPHGLDASSDLDASVLEPDASAVSDASSEGSVAEPPLEPACRRATKTVEDANTGISWTTVWYCANDSMAPIFETADGRAQVAHMETTDSWFVCYRRGEPHSGGNNVWYYTQGDKATKGWEARNGWGYMPGLNVHAEAHPFASVIECTANP